MEFNGELPCVDQSDCGGTNALACDWRTLGLPNTTRTMLCALIKSQ